MTETVNVSDESNKTEATSEGKTPFFPQEECDMYNEMNPHKLLTMAWNLFQYRQASRATLVAVSESGFILDIEISKGLFSKEQKKRLLHRYEIPVANAAEARVYLQDMFHRSNTPTISPGFSSLFAWFIFTMWAVTIVRIWSDGKEVTRTNVFYGYYVVFQAGLFIFPVKVNAIYALLMIVIPHIIEAAYVLQLAISLGFNYSAVMMWSAFTFVVGYPIMSRIILLDQLKVVKTDHIKTD